MSEEEKCKYCGSKNVKYYEEYDTYVCQDCRMKW